MSAIQIPKSLPDVIKLIAKFGKRSILVSGVDASAAGAASGKVVIDLTGVELLNEIEVKRDKVTIGTGINLVFPSENAELIFAVCSGVP